jgi:CheY-like chemotaxis protein
MNDSNCYNCALEVGRFEVIHERGGLPMKSALLLEYDDAQRAHTASLLNSLGYVVAPAATPQSALKTVEALRFDAVLTCTDANADDRRSLSGELARLAPGAAIVLLLDGDATGSACHQRAAALLFKPVTLQGLRRVLEFGVDGLGQHPLWVAPGSERRHGPQRRMRARRAGLAGPERPC